VSKPGFTIRIYVPDGEPDGVRIIDRMNWTGRGIVFPRDHWPLVKTRPEMSGPGIYILSGPKPNSDDHLPLLYIGQADAVGKRLEQHGASKDFWNRGIVFTSSMLHRGHVTWLEHMLIQRAERIGQCSLENGTSPAEPSLPEADKADTQAFLLEVLQILPLVGLRAFEEPKAVARPQQSPQTPAPATHTTEIDTVVVPAQQEGFERVFLGENCWHAIRISGGMLPKLK
jgi:hypothetical protein